MKYKKRPVVIDAIQYDGTNVQEIWDAFGAENIYGPTELNDYLIITTLEGDMRCPIGWWVIKGLKGEKYPCDPEVFVMSYEPENQVIVTPATYNITFNPYNSNFPPPPPMHETWIRNKY